MESYEKREKLEDSGLHKLYREFEAQWFPNKDVDTTLDFLLWLDKNDYVIIKAEDQL